MADNSGQQQKHLSTNLFFNGLSPTQKKSDIILLKLYPVFTAVYVKVRESPKRAFYIQACRNRNRLHVDTEERILSRNDNKCSACAVIPKSRLIVGDLRGVGIHET